MRAIAMVLMLVVACTSVSQPPTPSPTTAPATKLTSPPPTTTGTTLPSPACLAGDRPFGSVGRLGEGGLADSDSGVIADLLWELHGRCERLVVEFATADGAPAFRPPTTQGELVRGIGVVRVAFGEPVSDTAVADRLVEGRLLERAFVVRAEDGRLVLDLHLADPALARVHTSSSPAQVMIDLRPGGDPYPGGPLVGAEVVLTSPSGGRTAYPLEVAGYARTRFGEVRAILEGDDGRTEVSAPVADRTGAWGAFRLLIETGPTGAVELSIDDGGDTSPIVMTLDIAPP
ncbi:MAG: hypothetical protein ACRDVM_08320 [Acidimicrobiia bacterium]